VGRGKVVAQGTNGPIRWAVEMQGPALALFPRSTQNEMVRGALEVAGKQWGAVFLPKRFSHYVDRSPFPYPRHRDGFYLNKARRMGILQPIFQKLFMGWDPWSANRPPDALITDWKRKNPSKYRFSITGSYSGLIADLRANSKRMIFEIVRDMNGDDKFLPLVESGSARKSVLTNVSYRATATAKRQKLRISMPLGLRPGQEAGKGGTSKTVTEVLQTMPGWEVRWLGKKFAENLTLRLANRGYSVDARGMVTERAAPDFQAQQNQRSFSAVNERGAA